MIRDIIIYPDKLLKSLSREVEQFDETLHTLLDDMYETMVAKNGVGLAAIQIAVPLRVLIINVPIEVAEGEPDQPKSNTLEIINPVIVEESGSTMYQEGCLSVPGVYEDIERYSYAKIDYFDRHGNSCTTEDDKFLAIAIQHEMDHLNGKVFIEKLSYTKRKRFEKEWKKRGK
ncbi:MAG: peptide deformylase [Campylobacterota bacterium]|nr:peptide deformylase [Campylobacterota bacterium]